MKMHYAWRIAILLCQAVFGMLPALAAGPFTVNGDGTVTDAANDLVWQQRDDGAERIWADAVTYCTSLPLAGYSDWRLPEIGELSTLIDYDLLDPAIDTTAFSGAHSSYYWSDSTNVRSPGYSWNVDFGSGDVNWGNKADTYYVRCVRGEPFDPLSHLIINDAEAETATDTSDGLVWQRTHDDVQRTWEDASVYCESLVLDGKSEWRLPLIDELSRVIDYSQNYPATNTNIFPEMHFSRYWSGSTDIHDMTYAWYVNFIDGFVFEFSKDASYHVRCVHNGQDFYSLTITSQPISFREINGIRMPIISGTASYANTYFSHVEIALQDIQSGLYAALRMDGRFDAFNASTPEWVQIQDGEAWDFALFALVAETLSWHLPIQALEALAFKPGRNYQSFVRAVDTAGHRSVQQVLEFFYPMGAYTDLTMERSSATALFGETAGFEITGKLSRYPEVAGQNLQGKTISLRITRPDGTEAELQKNTHTNTGQYRFTSADTDFPDFRQKGNYGFQAFFATAPDLMESKSPERSVLVGESAGYALLVQGKISNGEGLAAHNKTVGRIYQNLKKRNFEDDNLFYLNYDPLQPGVDAVPSIAAVQGALESTDANSLLARMNNSPAPFYLILVDHGGWGGNFHLDNETLTPWQLSAWLDSFESKLNENAQAKPRIVIIGACYSGAFIPELSGPGRMIITSSAAEEVSYKGPLEADGIPGGGLFLGELFLHLASGNSFMGAFEKAVEFTKNATRRGTAAVHGTNPFRDDALQHPLLDDNGDGIGSNLLSRFGGDGAKAGKRYLGAVRPSEVNSGSDAEIYAVTNTLFLEPDEFAFTLEITVNNAHQVVTAPVDIRRPSVRLNEVLQEYTEQREIEDLCRIPTMDCNADINTCIVNITSATASEGCPAPLFGEPGKYELFYFVQDPAGNISSIRRSAVYKKKPENENRVPRDFVLLAPANGTMQPSTLLFDWNPAVDLDGDVVTYTLLLSASEQDFYANVVYKQEELTASMTYIDMKTVIRDGRLDGTTGLKDSTAYYWRVEAIDNYGAKNASAIFSFTAGNLNIPPNYAELNVVNAADYSSISAANIQIDIAEPVQFLNEGTLYGAVLPTGIYDVTVQHPGYRAVNVVLDVREGNALINLSLNPLITYAQERLHIPAMNIPGIGRYSADLTSAETDGAFIFTLDTGSLNAIPHSVPDEALLDLDGSGGGILTLPLVEAESASGSSLHYKVSMRMLSTNPVRFDLQEVVPVP
ncbi:MAG: DUF1566 domain-containing protein [Gammaproteobacteria bacterium]|nr:DUF1566 domain-containing protein [Gammaproteobacteria bacterium]